MLTFTQFLILWRTIEMLRVNSVSKSVIQSLQGLVAAVAMNGNRIQILLLRAFLVTLLLALRPFHHYLGI